MQLINRPSYVKQCSCEGDAGGRGKDAARGRESIRDTQSRFIEHVAAPSSGWRLDVDKGSPVCGSPVHSSAFKKPLWNQLKCSPTPASPPGWRAGRVCPLSHPFSAERSAAAAGRQQVARTHARYCAVSAGEHETAFSK